MLAQAESGGNAEELLRRQRQQQGAPAQRQQRPQGEEGGAPQRGPQQNEGQRQRPPAPDARQGEPGGQPGRRPEPPAPRQPELDAPRRESPPAAAQPRAGQPEPGAQAPRRQRPQPAEPEDVQVPRRTPEALPPDAVQKPPAPRAAPAEAPTPAAPQVPARRQNRTPQPGQPPAPGETAPANPAAPAPRAQEPRATAPDAQRPAGEAPVRQQPPQPAPPAPQTHQAPARQNVEPQPGQPAPAGAPRLQAVPEAPAQPAPGQAAPAQAAPAQPPAPGGRRDGQIGNRDGQVGNRDGRVGQDQGQPQERRRGLDPGAAAALGAAAGFVGGFVASQGVSGIDDVRQRREEFTDNGVTVIREPGRTIVQENGRSYLRHDETERFRDLGGDVRMERRGADQVTIYQRPDGTEVVTVTDETGRLIRRTRRYPDGQEVVIIDNGWDRRPARLDEEVVDLPPPRLRIPRERYVVNSEGADEETIYETLTAPEVDPVPRRYTLDQVRYSPDLRARMRSVDVDTITFETGSWEVDPGQAPRLRVLADAVRRAVDRNPREVFLVEGHTDAVGSDVDNLSLSDRRAQSVAAVLTRDFGVPPENLTTQGYGEQYLKVQTDGPSRENRRVTIRRITPLLNGPQTGQQ